MAQSDITFEQLRAVVTIVDVGSFSLAAEALYLTQPAISQRVRNLEETVGVQLFVRAPGRSVRLTPAGQVFVDNARRLLEGLSELTSALDAFPREPRESLTIACGSAMSRYLLPRYLSVFAHRYPRIGVRIEQADPRSILGEVARGRFDLGIGAGLSPSHELARARSEATLHEMNGSRQRLNTVRLDDANFILVTSPSIASHGDYQSLLASEPMLLPARDSYLRQCIDHWAGVHRFRLNIAAEIAHLDGIKEAVREGFGVTALPEFMVSDAIAREELVRLEAPGFPIAFTLYLMTSAAKAETLPVRAFLTVTKTSVWQPAPPDLQGC